MQVDIEAVPVGGSGPHSSLDVAPIGATESIPQSPRLPGGGALQSVNGDARMQRQQPGVMSPSRRISIAAAARVAVAKPFEPAAGVQQMALSPSFQLLLPRRMFRADTDGSAGAAVWIAPVEL